QSRRRHPGLRDLVVRLEGGAREHVRRQRGRAPDLLSGPNQARRRRPPGRRRRGYCVLRRPALGQVHRKCRQRRRRSDRRLPPVGRKEAHVHRIRQSDLTRKERSMQKRRWSLVVAAVLVAGVAVTAALAAPSRQATGKTYYFIPKDTLNPYEVIADR